MEKAQLVVGIALGGFTILGLWAGLIRHFVKYYLSELKPDGNGGHNLRGRIDHIEAKQERMDAKIDKIYEILLETRLAR
jgi:hypothetical protein